MNGPLMMDLESVELSAEEVNILKDERVGGVILFARNFVSPRQVKILCESIYQVRRELIIAVDQEGGRVQRFDTGFTKLPAVAEIPLIAKQNNLAATEVAKLLGWLMATEVRSVHVDISFAPVLDIDHGFSQIIGNRSFADSAAGVIELAGSYIQGMKQAGMASCGKHFPGHGSVIADSHLELPIDNRSKNKIIAEMEPFRELSSKLQGMMPAHVLYPEVDSENSAGFSSIWVNQILRQELLFSGVVFSDDLTMEGAVRFGSYIQRAEKAINAGCDMVLVCNKREAVKQLLDADVLLVNPESSNRISQLKSNQAIIDYDKLKEQKLWEMAVSLLNH
jgi:beta-N-acetylhexosaminidase